MIPQSLTVTHKKAILSFMLRMALVFIVLRYFQNRKTAISPNSAIRATRMKYFHIDD